MRTQTTYRNCPAPKGSDAGLVKTNSAAAKSAPNEQGSTNFNPVARTVHKFMDMCRIRRVIGAKWCGFRYPDHVNYFTLHSLRDVAARAGFSCQLVNKISLPVDDNISVLLRKPHSPN